MKTLRRFVGASAIAIMLVLASNAAQSADYYISMTADGFVPDYLEVNVGDTVYWVNEDYDYYDYHSTHSYTYPWNSGPVPVSYGVYLTVTKTGSFDYVDDYGYTGWGTLVVKPVGPPPATLISAPSRVDMVYDAPRDLLYITSGSTVLRYQLGSGSFLDPYQLSGNLMGADISPDGNTLMVADSSTDSTNVWVYLINLNTGQTNRVVFPSWGESGTFAVAYGGDGAALITSRYLGYGWVPWRRYDPATRSFTTSSSFIPNDSMVSSSGDLSTILLVESGISSGPIDLYDVASRSFLRTRGTERYNYEGAVSRDGSLFAIPTYSGTFIYDRAFNLVTNLGGPIGAAFHPAADVVFFPCVNTTYVQAYDTTTWQMLAQYDFQYTFNTPGNHAFNNGRIRISPDGEIIFVTVGGGVGYLRHGLNVPLSHRLVVAGNPASYGVPSPMAYGTYWLSHGTYLTFDVPSYVQTNGATYVATGWTGTGSAAGSGTGTEASFTLTANTTLTWDWAPFAASANVAPGSAGKELVLQWPSITSMTYDVLFATNLTSGFVPVATDLAATPPTNVYQATIGPAATGVYKVRMK